ncbi:unnamed protein product, partial [Rotaria sordida]
ISQHLGLAHSANGTACNLNLINLPSTNETQNSIDNLFSLCEIEASPVRTPSKNKRLSIDEEIEYYISSFNMDQQQQHVKFSNFWSSHEKRLPIMSSVV